MMTHALLTVFILLLCTSAIEAQSIEVVAKLQPPEKSMVLRPVAKAVELPSPEYSRPTLESGVEDSGCNPPQKGDFAGRSSCATASIGKLVVFAGISGSGKSTLAKELGKIVQAQVFSETEECDWPEWIRSPHPYSEFSSYVTFRALRLEALWEAKRIADSGQVAIVDSYYDKITSYYLGKPGMEWLISPSDPYYPVVEQLTALDTKNLPDADLIVLLDVDVDTWLQLLHSRGRFRDRIDGFQDSYAVYRAYLWEAVEKLRLEKNIPVIVYHPKFGDPVVEAEKLYNILNEMYFKS